MPKISIIIPVFNVELYLQRCINSILAQTFTDFECILINDGSSDNCPKICDEYAARDNRVVVIHQNNKGSAAARNMGLLKAQGEWIGFVDGDDWVEHDMFEKMYMKAISGNYDMVWCDYYDYCHGYDIKVQIEGLSNTDLIKRICNGQLHSSVCNKFIKKYICTNYDILFPSANFMEDFVFTIKYIYHANKIGYVNNTLYHYALNPYSITNDIGKLKIRVEDTYKNLFVAVDFLKQKYGANIIRLEPELSIRINHYKIIMLRIKETRNIEKVFSLYPDSHKYIFDKKCNVCLLTKILFLFATKKIFFPYILLDIFFPVKYSNHTG